MSEKQQKIATLKGIRTQKEFQYTPEYLSIASNVYLVEGGSVIEMEKFIRTFSLNEDAQIFPLFIGVFVLTETVLYSYAGGTLTALLTGLPSGQLWSHIDFGKYVVFGNGNVNLIRNTTTGVFIADYGVIVPLASAMCKHKGRIVLGAPTSYPDPLSDSSNVVAWSDIMSIEFLRETSPDQIRQNLSGWLRMGWEGQIWKLIPMGDKVIVYGDNGITALVPISNEIVASSYGKVAVHDIGLRNRGAACQAGENERDSLHYFIDATGWLYALDETLRPQKIGFKELFE